MVRINQGDKGGCSVHVQPCFPEISTSLVVIIDDSAYIGIRVPCEALDAAKEIQHVSCDGIVKGDNRARKQVRYKYRVIEPRRVSFIRVLQKLGNDYWEMISNVLDCNVTQMAWR